MVAALGALGLVLVYAGLTAPSPSKVRLRRLESLVREAGFKNMSGRGLIGLCVGLFLATFVLVTGLTSSIVVAGPVSGAVSFMPISVARSRRTRRRRQYREAWPEAIAHMISAIRSGMSLPEACMLLATRGPDGLRFGFGAFASTYTSSSSFVAGLATLKEELEDPIADRVVAALSLAHEVGGPDLVRVLRTLNEFLREDLRIRREIEARWSWTVTAARVAVAAPWIVLLLMATKPEAAAAYNSATGAIVVAGGGAATWLGYRLMLRAARLPEDRRLA